MQGIGEISGEANLDGNRRGEKVHAHIIYEEPIVIHRLPGKKHEIQIAPASKRLLHGDAGQETGSRDPVSE